VRNLARKCIRDLKPYEPGRPIEEIKRDLGIKKVVKLASNENPIGASKKAIKAILDMTDRLNRYPDGGCFYLKRKLSGVLNVKESNLIFGNGSNEIIELVTRAYLNEGEEAVVAEPSFLIFKLATAVQGGVPVAVPLKSFSSSQTTSVTRFNYDLNAMKKAVTAKTKIVFIDNPNNPIGISVGKKELERFLGDLPKDIIVVLDEAYNEFVERNDFPDSLKYIDRGNVIVLRTFSKAYGLSGLRVGYGVASSKIIEYMNKVRQPFNVSSVAQAAALASLNDKAFIKKVRSLVLKEKYKLYYALDKMGLKYVGSDTNFVLINIKQDSKNVFNRMLKKGVIVRDMCAYGLRNYIRVTIGKPSENRKFLKVLKKIIHKD